MKPVYEDAPCQGCQNRFVKEENGKTIVCHSVCEKYQAFRKMRDAWNKEQAIKNHADLRITCRKFRTRKRR